MCAATRLRWVQRIDFSYPIGNMRVPDADGDRISVGRGARHPPGPDASGGPADILDDDGLAKRCAHAFGDQAPDHIGQPAGRKRHHHCDGP
jgi:hypothetical protein